MNIFLLIYGLGYILYPVYKLVSEFDSFVIPKDFLVNYILFLIILITGFVLFLLSFKIDNEFELIKQKEGKK